MESRYLHDTDKPDIEIGKIKKGHQGKGEVLIVNVNGNYYAVDNIFTHFGGDLSEGTLEGNAITCPNN